MATHAVAEVEREPADTWTLKDVSDSSKAYDCGAAWPCAKRVPARKGSSLSLWTFQNRIVTLATYGPLSLEASCWQRPRAASSQPASASFTSSAIPGTSTTSLARPTTLIGEEIQRLLSDHVIGRQAAAGRYHVKFLFESNCVISLVHQLQTSRLETSCKETVLSLITLTGNETGAQACTCREYVRRILNKGFLGHTVLNAFLSLVEKLYARLDFIARNEHMFASNGFVERATEDR